MQIFSLSDLKKISFKNVSRILFVFSLITLVFMPMDVLAIYFAPSPSQKPAQYAYPSADQIVKEDTVAYKQAFKLSRAFGELSADAGDMLMSASIDKVLANIQFKGIVTIGSAEAILEDKATRKTFFAKTGDMLQGLQVKKIDTDSVTFSDGENDKTLTLGGSL